MPVPIPGQKVCRSRRCVINENTTCVLHSSKPHKNHWVFFVVVVVINTLSSLNRSADTAPQVHWVISDRDRWCFPHYTSVSIRGLHTAIAGMEISFFLFFFIFSLFYLFYINIIVQYTACRDLRVLKVNKICSNVF